MLPAWSCAPHARRREREYSTRHAFLPQPRGLQTTPSFSTHAKNLVRFGETLIPFHVIPCRPAGGFLQFIADTLAAGHAVKEVRTVSTSPRAASP